MSEEKHYPEGTFLFKPGEHSEKVFYLQCGEVRLSGGAQARACKTINAPNLLGVNDLMNTGYTASAKVSSGAAHVYEIRKEDLLALINENLELRLYLIRLMSQSLMQEAVYE